MSIGAGPGRRLVLLRHAKSAWPDMPDHERPLAHRGQRDAPVMGGWLRTVGLVPDLVVCSTARRARETWQLAQAALGAAPSARFDERVYQASAAQLLDLIRGGPATTVTLLVVGHDPGVPGLALTLAGTAPDDRAGAGPGTVHSYAVNDHPRGPCALCGEPVEPPAGLSLGRQPDLDAASPWRGPGRAGSADAWQAEGTPERPGASRGGRGGS